MSATRVPVNFQPADVTVWVTPGTTLIDAARRASIVLPAPCGGRGVCGSCGVAVLSGQLGPVDDAERAGLRRARDGVRLACRARIAGAVSVRPLAIEALASSAAAGQPGPSGRLVAGVDLGTTSVAAVIVDSETGRELARASVANRQQSFGADVLARLSAAADGERDELARLAETSVLAALDAASTAAGTTTGCIERLVIAGNSAMSALFAGADTSALATFPFEAPPTGGPIARGSRTLAALAPRAVGLLVAPIAGFVGGDAVAAATASGMISADAPVLLVDFGTNAEIVLANEGRLTVASAAAGPAFEGGGIACGGPAADGAITRVHVGGDGGVDLESIGDEAGTWFSGSGLVSAISELLRVGVLDRSGRMSASGILADRVSLDAEGVVQVRLGTTADEGPWLSQRDVRAFQLAKAAVRVGVGAVLAAGDVRAEELERVCVAGAFGMAMVPDDLVALGILPAATEKRIVQVGNAALDGAAAFALDPSVQRLGEDAARTAVHVELAADPGFARALVAATELEPFGV